MTVRAKTPKAKPPRAGHRNKGVASQARAKASKAKAQTAEPLREYARKRDFSRTAEPEPAPAPYPSPRPVGKAKGVPPPPPVEERREEAAGSFVVQKHAARRVHYDLRLELDGVLKSWAVTRGPSLVLGEKRLAVHTEDHPIEYLDFEGNIPRGEYGAGAMIVWDRGRWIPQGDPHKALQKGHLEFVLEGQRLKGRWHLVRIRPRPGEKTEPWLLIKAEDAFARGAHEPAIIDEETTSFLSGRTTEELAAQGELRVDHTGRAKVARPAIAPLVEAVRGARKGILPPFLEPSHAQTAELPPSGPKWVHEIKYDGYRIQARIDGSNVKLLTRKALDWSDRFPRLVTALRALRLASAWIDGEIVVEDSGGIPSFNLLQADISAGRDDRLRYFVFDLLYCDGFDLTKATLLERKTLLEQIVQGVPASSPIRFSEHLAQDGPTMFEHACRLGLEGIVSKRADLPHRRAAVSIGSRPRACCVRNSSSSVTSPRRPKRSRSGRCCSAITAKVISSMPAASVPGIRHSRRDCCARSSRSFTSPSRNLRAPCRLGSTRPSAGSRPSSSGKSSSAASRAISWSGRHRSRACGKTGRPKRSSSTHRCKDRRRRSGRGQVRSIRGPGSALPIRSESCGPSRA